MISEKSDKQSSLCPIHDFLTKNAQSHRIRCYMPGHKGVENPLDITEINGADSLYESDFFGSAPGIIAQSERNASRLFGTVQTLYSCSGSTLAIQTMLALAKQKSGGKDHIIAGRYSHRSFINTCILLGLTPSWVYPQSYLGADISVWDIESKINDRTMAVFINSVDYYGGRSDIKAISELCKKCRIPLLVDNAHGAYLKFTEKDRHPITLGADMCADSAHKTLPVLTGGAYLHIGNKKYCENAKETMSLFGTSSPSYLILDSLDRCNKELTEHPNAIKELCQKITVLKCELSAMGHHIAPSDDIRLVLDCRAMNSTGFKAAEILSEFGIECEYADEYKCVLLFGYSTSDEDIKTIREVLKANTPPLFACYSLPPQAEHIRAACSISPAKAFFKMKQRIELKYAVGKVCGTVVAPCPPGVPLIMPGEIISQAAADMLARRGVKYVETVI